MSLQQAHLFYIFMLTGILIGLLFDAFRVLRKSFKVSDTSTIIQDVIFFIITSLLIIYTLFKFNNGVLRGYVILGITFGAGIYFLLFSKVFISINVKIIHFIKKVFKLIIKIAIFPFNLIYKIIRKIFLKPISFIFINIRKITNCIIAKYYKKLKKITINNIKSKKKTI